MHFRQMLCFSGGDRPWNWSCDKGLRELEQELKTVSFASSWGGDRKEPGTRNVVLVMKSLHVRCWGK